MTLEEAMKAVDAEIEAAKPILSSQEVAFWAGHSAGKKNAPISDNPYAEKALFDPEQLSAAWLKGRKAAIDQRYRRTRHSGGWNRA